jgi:hypothetical protein
MSELTGRTLANVGQGLRVKTADIQHVLRLKFHAMQNLLVKAASSTDNEKHEICELYANQYTNAKPEKRPSVVKALLSGLNQVSRDEAQHAAVQTEADLRGTQIEAMDQSEGNRGDGEPAMDKVSCAYATLQAYIDFVDMLQDYGSHEKPVHIDNLSEEGGSTVRQACDLSEPAQTALFLRTLILQTDELERLGYSHFFAGECTPEPTKDAHQGDNKCGGVTCYLLVRELKVKQILYIRRQSSRPVLSPPG